MQRFFADHPCIYARAVKAMLVLRSELGLEGNSLEQTTLQNLALFLHEWAINRGDLDDANALQRVLDSYLYPGLSNYDQLYIDIGMQKCLYFRRTQNWEKAKEIAKNLVDFCKRQGRLNNQARILIHMAIMQLESDRNQCTAALPTLLEALSICQNWEMHGLHAAGMSILASVFLRLRNPKRAISILEGVLPTLIQREHVWFQAEAYFTLSKSHLKIGSISSAKTMDKTTTAAPFNRKRFEKALLALNKSVELFEECQDCFRLRETLYLQAHIHSLLGNLDKREASSERFVKIGTNKPVKYHNGGVPFTILDALNDPIQLLTLVDRSIY
jgi:tetratricopeptide (TPR) repeat protein